MDDCRFDNWTRGLAGTTDRRAAVRGLAAGAAALLTLARAELGFAQEADVTLEKNCKGDDAKCKRDNDCCSKKCKRGRCTCAGQGASCKRDNGCCSGICRNGSCACGDKGDFCNNDSDCCSKKCRNGKCLCTRGGDRCSENRECCSGRCSSGFCTNS